MTRSKRKSSLAAVAVASMLLAAPTANARLDEGGGAASAGEDRAERRFGRLQLGRRRNRRRRGPRRGGNRGAAGRAVRKHGLPAHP